jgi:hypothetical protein
MGAMAIDRTDLASQAVIVSLPDEIDMTNAEQVGLQRGLLSPACTW